MNVAIVNIITRIGRGTVSTLKALGFSMTKCDKAASRHINRVEIQYEEEELAECPIVHLCHDHSTQYCAHIFYLSVYLLNICLHLCIGSTMLTGTNIY